MHIPRRLATMAFAGVIVSLAWTQSAQAGFQLKFSEAGFADTVINWDGTTKDAQGNAKITFTGNYGDFSIDLTVSRSNTPGTSSQAFLSVAHTNITNNNGSSQTINVSLSADFNNPVAPLPTKLSNTASGTLVAGTTVAGSFDSFLGTSLFDTSGTHAGAINFSLNGTGSFGPANTSVQLFSMPSNFTLTNVGSYTIGGNSIFDTTGGGTTLTPAPEPATVVAALTGLPLLVLASWLRRRGKTA
jgi:hypothetical protein